MLIEGQKFEKFIIESRKNGPNQVEDSYSKIFPINAFRGN